MVEIEPFAGQERGDGHDDGLARIALDAIPSEVAVVAHDGTILLTNRAWDRFATENGGDPDELGVGTSYLDVCSPPGSGDPLSDALLEVLDGSRLGFEHEYRCDSPEGPRWFVMHGTAIDEGLVVSHVDVTAHKTLEAVLHTEATTDVLTDVLNRRGTTAELRSRAERLRRDGSLHTAIVIDLDDFKRVNDHFGHAAGDIVLRAVARRVADVLRATDSIGRIGGDEFVILLSDSTIAETAQVAERVRLAMAAAPVAVGHEDVTITLSIAVLALSPAVSSLEAVLERSRASLRSSKDRGKNRVTVLHPSSNRMIDLTADQLDVLTIADSITVLGQPVVDLATREIVAIELLARPSEELSMAAVLHAAADQGVLTAVDERCLIAAVRASRGVRPGLTVHLGLLPSTLVQLPLDRVGDLVSGDRRFVVELSEQQILGEPSYLLGHVRALKAAGARVAITDVGFGRTCLESLVILEPDVVRLDEMYVRGVRSDRHRQAWLRRLCAVAHSLGAEIVADGVDDADDAKTVASLGVTAAQGSWCGQPAALSSWA